MIFIRNRRLYVMHFENLLAERFEQRWSKFMVRVLYPQCQINREGDRGREKLSISGNHFSKKYYICRIMWDPSSYGLLDFCSFLLLLVVHLQPLNIAVASSFPFEDGLDASVVCATLWWARNVSPNKKNICKTQLYLLSSWIRWNSSVFYSIQVYINAFEHLISVISLCFHRKCHSIASGCDVFHAYKHILFVPLVVWLNSCYCSRETRKKNPIHFKPYYRIEIRFSFSSKLTNSCIIYTFFIYFPTLSGE